MAASSRRYRRVQTTRIALRKAVLVEDGLDLSLAGEFAAVGLRQAFEHAGNKSLLPGERAALVKSILYDLIARQIAPLHQTVDPTADVVRELNRVADGLSSHGSRISESASRSHPFPASQPSMARLRVSPQ